MTELLAMLSFAVIYYLIRCFKDRKIEKQQDEYWDKQLKMIEDPDYFKEHSRIEGWDRDHIYNKYGIHVMDEFGGKRRREMEEELTRQWKEIFNKYSA